MSYSVCGCGKTFYVNDGLNEIYDTLCLECFNEMEKDGFF